MFSSKFFDLGQSIVGAFIVGALMFVSPAVFAQGGAHLSGGYIGIIGGSVDEDPPPGYVPTGDSNAGTVRLYGGYRWPNNIAVELSLNAIGDEKLTCSAGTQTIERGSSSVSWLYHLHLNDTFSVFPKFGIAGISYDYGNRLCGIRYVDEDGTEVSEGASLVVGVGAEFRVSDNLGIRVDIDKGTLGIEEENYSVGAGLSVYF